MSMTAVKSVDPRSPAQRAGVRVGDTLTHINGHPIVDVLDYKFYSYDPRLELTLRGADGSVRTEGPGRKRPHLSGAQGRGGGPGAGV